MADSIITIFGSARAEGDSAKAISTVFEGLGMQNHIVNISNLNINHYDYDNKNSDDDFVNIIEKIIETGKVVFCTPVYWYSMSAYMKMFFDRLSDLITIRKDLGRKLKGVKTYLVYCGASPVPPEYFSMPIIDTCNYFEMDYKGELYYPANCEGEARQRYLEEVTEFKKLIIS